MNSARIVSIALKFRFSPTVSHYFPNARRLVSRTVASIRTASPFRTDLIRVHSNAPLSSLVDISNLNLANEEYPQECTIERTLCHLGRTASPVRVFYQSLARPRCLSTQCADIGANKHKLLAFGRRSQGRGRLAVCTRSPGMLEHTGEQTENTLQHIKAESTLSIRENCEKTSS